LHKEFIPEELTVIQALYVIYDERGIIFDCNNGRITGMHEEKEDA
jgi:hypothetical protein